MAEDPREQLQMILEMFPHLDLEGAKKLVSREESLTQIVSRILEDNMDTPSISLRDITAGVAGSSTCRYSYNYPEVFQKRNSILDSDTISRLREQARQYMDEAARAGREAQTHRIATARTHYSIEADRLRDKAASLNRQAAIALMKRSLEKEESLDLHGLFVHEALDFLEDILYFRNSSRIRVITGRLYNSQKLRPAVEKWFIKHGYSVTDDGPALIGDKIR